MSKNLRSLVKSQKLRARAEDVIAHGALTNSKRPQSFVQGVYPTHLRGGLDAVVHDVDGNRYVDYICGLGTHLFGYKNDNILGAVQWQLNHDGTILSLGTELEVEVAEAIRDTFPYMERIRFLKTGSEACSSAIRIARAFHGPKRHLVLSDGYHGHMDSFVSLTPPHHGVPEDLYTMPLNGNWALIPEAAAVIIEPVVTDHSEERVRYLHEMRGLTAKHGALLIFDEVITGLRFPSLSVSKHTGIDPDLSILGKAIGGGLPLAVVGGRKDVMETDYFVSSTFAGDCVALAAAREVMRLIRVPGVMERLHLKGNEFCKAFNAVSPELVTIEGYGTRGVFKAKDDLTKALFLQESCKAGILFGPSFFYGTKHEDHNQSTLSVVKTVLSRIRNDEVRLEGEMPQTPYAQRVREQG